MEMNEFIKKIADQYDDLKSSALTAETEFRNVDGWSSLIALSILNMISKNYGVTLSIGELRQTDTIKEVFDLVLDKTK